VEQKLVGRYEDFAHKRSGGRPIGGKVSAGEALTTIMARAEGALLVLIELKTGFVNSTDGSGHAHPQHESIGYVLSGRLRMRIGTEDHVLEPGSSWFHPRGVPHFTEALEDTKALEFHVPVRQDILEL
jgi:quercetin dioxygenase-like cupin family protein